jgi:hypothetical protein
MTDKARAAFKETMSGTESACAFVASIRIRPRQSIPFRASATLTQFVARMTTSHSAARCFVPRSRLDADQRQNQPGLRSSRI